MFRLARLRVIPSIFLYLKDDMSLCESCMFGKSSGGKYITKVNKSVSISKETDNNPGFTVSLDHLQSISQDLSHNYQSN